MSGAKVGVIGGSGFYNLSGLSDTEEARIETPFGPTSDPIIIGTLEGVRVAFVTRHGEGHRILPSEVPFRANIWALKSLGVERCFALNAVGSLREEIPPLDLVVPGQLIDHTRDRPSTFFGRGLVAHVAFDRPFCPALSDLLMSSARALDSKVHHGGAYVAVDGPAFSTRAEAQIYRSWGASVIGMTAAPEAQLAREAEICYAMLALVTDYDTWNDDYAPVTGEMVIENLLHNFARAQRIVGEAVRMLPAERECGCGNALATALITSVKLVPDDVKRDLAPIIGKYMPAGAEAWHGR
jgi:5'-methylthioadenosine phosphorylase